jgi:hypothetical protein
LLSLFFQIARAVISVCPFISFLFACFFGAHILLLLQTKKTTPDFLRELEVLSRDMHNISSQLNDSSIPDRTADTITKMSLQFMDKVLQQFQEEFKGN